MDYKKKYKEALERARELYDKLTKEGTLATSKGIESIFPELRESEDEKIWKVVKEYINQHYPVDSPVMYKSKILNWLENQNPIKLNEEDERIRKEIYRYFRDLQLSSDREFSPSISIDEILAWLEKQGEQKPIDMIEPKFKPGDKIVEKDIYECGSGTIKEIRDGKYIFEDNCFIYIKEQDLWQLVKEPVEPKFKVGDWVVNKLGHVWHIDSFDKKNYQVSNGDKYNYFPISKQNEMHLWTIQDAEDGDMLAEHETIVLFKKIEDQNIRCYCTYHYLGFNPTFYVGTLQNKNPYCPATKEQRDLLLQKMKEAGYEWDVDKKELKKIERKPDFCHHKVDLSNCSEEYRKAYYDGWNNCNQQHEQLKAEQKSSWSEEDEDAVDIAIRIIQNGGDDCAGILDSDKALKWINSIKDRVKPQQKQEWSEYDKIQLSEAIQMIEANGTWIRSEDAVKKVSNWLKSLKPNHWKPSEQNIKDLEWCADSVQDKLGVGFHRLQVFIDEIKNL